MPTSIMSIGNCGEGLSRCNKARKRNKCFTDYRGRDKYIQVEWSPQNFSSRGRGGEGIYLPTSTSPNCSWLFPVTSPAILQSWCCTQPSKFPRAQDRKRRWPQVLDIGYMTHTDATYRNDTHTYTKHTPHEHYTQKNINTTIQSCRGP